MVPWCERLMCQLSQFSLTAQIHLSFHEASKQEVVQLNSTQQPKLRGVGALMSGSLQFSKRLSAVQYQICVSNTHHEIPKRALSLPFSLPFARL